MEKDSNQDILNFLQASIIDSNKYMTKEDAIRHINSYVAYTPLIWIKNSDRKKHEFTLEVLSNDLFPHCRTVAQKVSC